MPFDAAMLFPDLSTISQQSQHKGIISHGSHPKKEHGASTLTEQKPVAPLARPPNFIRNARPPRARRHFAARVLASGERAFRNACSVRVDSCRVLTPTAKRTSGFPRFWPRVGRVELPSNELEPPEASHKFGLRRSSEGPLQDTPARLGWSVVPATVVACGTATPRATRRNRLCLAVSRGVFLDSSRGFTILRTMSHHAPLVQRPFSRSEVRPDASEASGKPGAGSGTRSASSALGLGFCALLFPTPLGFLFKLCFWKGPNCHIPDPPNGHLRHW